MPSSSSNNVREEVKNWFSRNWADLTVFSSIVVGALVGLDWLGMKIAELMVVSI